MLIIYIYIPIKISSYNFILNISKGANSMLITRIYYAIAYFVVLIFEIIKAEIDVAFRTINGDVKPVIMEIETVLARPISQTILANSITLTPGTLSIDLDSEKRILKVATIVKRDKKAVIPFEHYIKGMLE